MATATQVRVAGELWAFRCDEPLAADDPVRVDVVDGLSLVVTPLSRAPR